MADYDWVDSIPFNHANFFKLRRAVRKLLESHDPQGAIVTESEKEELLDLIDEITQD